MVQGPWGSLFKSRITNSAEIVERPHSRKYKITGQAGTENVTIKSLLWGCPGMNFKVTLPFHEMGQAYAAFEKRSPQPCNLLMVLSKR